MARSSARAVAFTFGSVLAGALLIGVEAAARRYEAAHLPDVTRPTPETPGVVMAPNPYLLWEHAPGDSHEYGVDVHINHLGLRGPEPVIPKPLGVRRILATGDSSVYGYGVPEDATFVRVAAEGLGGAAAGVEGWTAALPGYSTLQTLNLLEMRALTLKPDLLVIAGMWSDHLAAEQTDAELLDVYVRFDRSPAGLLDRALHHLAMYRVVDWELGVRRGSQATARGHWNPAPSTTRTELRRVPIAAYAENLEAIVRLAEDHGADVAFLMLPHPDDLTRSDPGRGSFGPYREVMRDTANRHGAVIVDGGAVFRDAVARDPGVSLFLDQIHPSVAGHRALGDALATALVAWAHPGTPPPPGTTPARP